MNSVVQCLSAAQPLRHLFADAACSGAGPLNLNNPLGYGGRVATGFGSLMEAMHRDPSQGGGSRVSPRAFKRLIGARRSWFLCVCVCCVLC